MKPQIVAITGSVGKSSTKAAIAAVLSQQYRVKSTAGSYNTDIGIFLDILGQKSAFKSVWGWIKILFNGMVCLFRHEHYDYYIIEMGADHPGDIEHLVKIFPPTWAVITNIKPVHLAPGQFTTLEDIAAEKGWIFRILTAKETALVNADDVRVAAIQTKARSLTYGQTTSDFQVVELGRRNGTLIFDVKYQNQTYAFTTRVLGDYHIYVFLPAIVLGFTLGVPYADIQQAIANWEPPRGRLRLLPGKKETLIIDSSYNSSPEAVAAALEILKEQPGRRIAVLGSMNELGDFTATAHQALMEKAVQCADVIVLVGRVIQEYGLPKLVELGWPSDKIFTHDEAAVAGKLFINQLKPGDVILVKGSQNGVFLERFVKEIMLEPERAAELLVRQGGEWNKK